MEYSRINNYRMAAYAALAAGLINLRYQTGSEGNLLKSLVLVLPGAIILALSLTSFGKKWLEGKSAAVIVTTVGSLLLIYSFIL